MDDVKILLVEDESVEAIELKRTLEFFGYSVPYIVSSGEAAVEKAQENRPDLILMDIFLKGDSDGIEAASKIKKLNIPLIYLTAHSEESLIERAKLTEPYGYIIKPYDSNELKYTIELALYKNKMENELKESEKRYKELVDNSMVGIYKTNLKGDIIFANAAMAEIFDFESVEAMKTKKSFQLYKDPVDREKMIQRIQKEGSFRDQEVEMVTNKGKTITIILSAHMEDNTITGMIMDINERKQMENALRESEEKYRTLFEEDPYFNMVLGKDGTILEVNNTITKVTGLAKEEFIGKDFSKLETIPPENMVQYHNKISRLLEGKYIEPFESQFKDKKGNISWILVHLKAVIGNGNISYILAIGTDITERKIAEDKIKSSLKEKNILLQEIHHRVKNNMQIISSLLNLQIQYVDDREAIDVLKESQNRVKSMAMIHEKLYLSKNLSHINFVEYINSLVSNLFYSYNVDDRIKPILKIDNVSLNMETAVPCGLIISELVSNSLKYAFPNGKKGEIHVSLKSEEDRYELTIGDNGIGLPEKLELNHIKTLGLRLVNSLTKQIEGEVTINRSHGTEFKIRFKELKYKERL